METNKQLEQEMPKTNFLHREVNIRINNKEIKCLNAILNYEILNKKEALKDIDTSQMKTTVMSMGER